MDPIQTKTSMISIASLLKEKLNPLRSNQLLKAFPRFQTSRSTSVMNNQCKLRVVHRFRDILTYPHAQCTASVPTKLGNFEG